MSSETVDINSEMMRKLQLDPDDETDVEIAVALETTKKQMRKSAAYAEEVTEILNIKAWAHIINNLRTSGTVLS